MKKMWFLVVIALLIVPSAFAAQDSITLLALTGRGENATGIFADLHLETRAGSERVFLDTFPLTQISTQISMRFAQQVACDELNTFCSNTDFFYTIRATSGIVGGPSAGAAAAVLTAALIDGRTLDRKTAITGTINSGGLIGPVGGLKEKIKAAAKGGSERVLIPKGTSMLREDNTTTDLIEYGHTLGIEVIEVATLDQALEIFTGKSIIYEDKELVLDPAYKVIMQDIAIDLCTRGRDLLAGRDLNALESIFNLSTIADDLFAAKEYYSAASYCFRANIEINELELQDLDLEEFQDIIAQVHLEVRDIDVKTENQPLKSVTDLQTYMLVKERIFEAQEVLERLEQTTNLSESNIRSLAYARERVYSAVTWSRFFQRPGPQYKVDNQTLANSCNSKLGEAEERYNYVQSFFPNSLSNTRETLDRAQEFSQTGNYVLCLHDAARAKAEADILLSITGFSDENLQDVIDVKLNTTRRSIIRAQERGIFPLIGYSYWEYSKTLREEDPYSSLLFAEYANELSNLDIYFRKPALNIPRVSFEFTPELALAFFLGFLIGGYVIYHNQRRR